MKRFVLIAILFCSVCLLHGQKFRMAQTPKSLTPGDFPIHVHISASHLRTSCSGSTTPAGVLTCGYGLFADADVDGKKVELWGGSEVEKHKLALIAPGDYTAQLTKNDHNADQSVISQSYNLRLPDGTLWPCQLSGITE
jgi:hypothetical protein